MNLQFFGGRGSTGGNAKESAVAASAKATTKPAAKTEAASKPVKKTSSSKGFVKNASLDSERDMPQVAISGIKQQDYSIVGKLDMNKSNIQVGDSFGIRSLGMRNWDTYGKVTKVTNSYIEVKTPGGGSYRMPTKQVEITGKEARFMPKDKNSKWFGFVDLRKSYSTDDFKKK